MTELKEEQQEQVRQSKQQGKRRRMCDFCGAAATAVLHCRADAANLCLSCDREVHATNPLFTKHTRSLLCDACDSSAATIFCCTHAAVFCQNCDWQSHPLSLSPSHVRRPIEGFSGCPSVAELMAAFGFEDVGKKEQLFEDDFGVVGDGNGDDGISDFLVWDTPTVVSIDDLIAPNDSKPSFQAMGVPPLPKNRNAACGQHKEEILSQLREMSKLEPNLCGDRDEFEPVGGFQTMENELNDLLGSKGSRFNQNTEPASVDSDPYSEASSLQWYNYLGEFEDQGFGHTLLHGYNNETNCLVPDKDSDVGDKSAVANHNKGLAETPQAAPKVAPPRELNSKERETAICRYKEKKKTRRYEKQIRYESRKVRAETRIRIKGRFAKMERRDTATR